jgi:hypothetical protein
VRRPEGETRDHGRRGGRGTGKDEEKVVISLNENV